MKISILASQMPWERGPGPGAFYPLVKWKKDFLKAGIVFEYFNSHLNQRIKNADILIFDQKYFKNLMHNKIPREKEFVIEFIEKIKKCGMKVVLYDAGDSTGSSLFWITPYVDVHLKKQLLKDINAYAVNGGDQRIRCWIPADLALNDIHYEACGKENLQKLKLGWNLALADYRQFPLGRYYPIDKSILLNSIYKQPRFFPPCLHRKLVTSFRGTVGQDMRYSFQRKILVDTLDQYSDAEVRKGGFLCKKKYYAEMIDSKALVSPFGWGELCYRDFEAFICGAVLIKPSLNHLRTFPDLFIEKKTYLPVKWNMSDLSETLEVVIQNYEQYIQIAISAQNLFRCVLSDAGSFISHFKASIIS